MRRLLALLALLAPPAWAQDVAGEFDYYVLSLSWSANWCALEGDARQSPQCDADRDHGWILHGLWPQYRSGYPEYCRSGFSPPSHSDTRAMADIMGTSGLAWHQWRKHGVCSGLSPDDYYDLSRQAYEKFTRPEVFRQLENPVTLPAKVVEEAFLRDNPTLMPDHITITCKQGYIQEARICLDRDLNPMLCGDDVVRDCTLDDAQFDPMR
ncbi:ribonuclease T2 family protein [Yoonia sp. R2-816]|uniref:ribonuclease T2 family protein n=1 Tax=Yoonia sp. R2-816 TaxID=3342638 RepID=UPI00372C0182